MNAMSLNGLRLDLMICLLFAFIVGDTVLTVPVSAINDIVSALLPVPDAYDLRNYQNPQSVTV
jgi:hypothetical protein